MSESTKVECGYCGSTRPAKFLEPGADRTPCPQCGATHLKFIVSVIEHVPAPVDSISWEITPGDQTVGWERRWELIQTKLQQLHAVQRTQGSSPNIHELAGELRGFFVQLYHLKDALKVSSTQTGIAGGDVENAISNSPTLALLADLANLDKHGQLTKTPRSGTVPIIGKISGASAEGGWVLKMQIQHGADLIDGMDFANNAVLSWTNQLTQWGLI